MKNQGDTRTYLAVFAGERVRVQLYPRDVDGLETLTGGRLEAVRERVYETIRRELEIRHELRYPAYKPELWRMYRVAVWPIRVELARP